MQYLRNRKMLSLGACLGACFAILIQKKIYFQNEYIKTVLIAFLPWFFAELFNYIYNKKR